MSYLVVLMVLLVVVLVVTEPLRRRAGGRDTTAEDGYGRARSEVVELEAARDAKYREIRDAELDHQTGKLSDEDWRAIDSTLRAEALLILRELDRVSEGRSMQTGRA